MTMVVCFRIGGVEHCFTIPTVEFPLGGHRPGPGPVNYPPFLHDATVVASLNAAINKVSDAGVRNALQTGIKAAVEALKKRGGEYVSSIRLES